MAKKQTQKIIITQQFESDLYQVFEYGELTFGYLAARGFISEIYGLIDELSHTSLQYPECRFIPTKNQIYRNIIWGPYLIIYRITDLNIQVLRIIHGRSSIKKIQKARKVKI